jgi:purine-binding chemotaxis protein CheW
MIDSVGDVLPLAEADFENVPPTLDEKWRSVATGIYKLNEKILVVLDVERLLLTAQNVKGDEHEVMSDSR